MAHPDRKAQRALQRLVGATLCKVDVVADLDALLRVIDPDTVVVVDGALALTRPALRDTAARAWIAVPGEGNAPSDGTVTSQLLGAGWTHVVAHPLPIIADELLTTVQKVLRAEAFGLEKYMAWGAEIRSYTLDDARDRDGAVAELAKDVVAVGLPDRVSSLVSVIADELIANALYAAPVDESGARFRAHDARDQSRVLSGRDAVTVRWGTDARYLAIEVRDKWGSIDPMAIAKRLADARKHSAGTGEGMGLQLAYACCNQFVVGLAAGELTEVVTLLDVRYKPTELGRTASFHAFTGKAP